MSSPATHPRTVIAAGGSGFVGRIVVADLVRRGSTVAVPTRRPRALEGFAASLEEAPGRLVVVPLEGDDPYGSAQWALRAEVPEVSAVVATIGGWFLGPPLIELADDAWSAALESHLSAHLAAVRAYAPLVEEASDPVYVTANGIAAEQPLAGSGAISVTGAAQRMLLEVMRVEPIGDRIRFHEITYRAAVAGDPRNVDPETELAPSRVAESVRRVLADPSTEALVGVDP
jgi:NADP-dependent 3-hydroxy acid dehydrogenase YdfG